MTAPPHRFIPHGVMRSQRVLSGPDGKPPTWSQRLEAFKYVPPLLKLVYETHRGYRVAIPALRGVHSFLPLAVLWIGKLIIDGGIAGTRVRAGVGAVDWGWLGGLVALELGIGVGGDGSARLSALLQSPLGALCSKRPRMRPPQRCGPL